MSTADDAARPGSVSGRDRSRVVLGVAAVVALLVALGVGWLLGRGADDAGSSAPPSRATDDSVCEPLGARVALRTSIPEIALYLRADLGPDDIEAVARRLQDDDRIASASYVDATETYAEFRRMFEGQTTMLENVRLGDLPTSFLIRLVDNGDAPAVVRSLEALPGDVVEHVANLDQSGARVLDGLVWAGHDPEVRSAGSWIARRVYGGAWQDQVAAVVRAARDDGDRRLAAAADALAAEIEDRNGRPRPLESVSVDVAEAAALVEATAAERCDLEPIAAFTTRPGS